MVIYMLISSLQVILLLPITKEYILHIINTRISKRKIKCQGVICEIYTYTFKDAPKYVPIIEVEYGKQKYRIKANYNESSYKKSYEIGQKVVVGFNYETLEIVIWNRYGDCFFAMFFLACSVGFFVCAMVFLVLIIK